MNVTVMMIGEMSLDDCDEESRSEKKNDQDDHVDGMSKGV